MFSWKITTTCLMGVAVAPDAPWWLATIVLAPAGRLSAMAVPSVVAALSTPALNTAFRSLDNAHVPFVIGPQAAPGAPPAKGKYLPAVNVDCPAGKQI